MRAGGLCEGENDCSIADTAVVRFGMSRTVARLQFAML